MKISQSAIDEIAAHERERDRELREILAEDVASLVIRDGEGRVIATAQNARACTVDILFEDGTAKRVYKSKWNELPWWY